MSDTPEVRDPERLDLPSASQMEIVVACPGSVNMKSRIPKEELEKNRTEEDDEWAERGTRIHSAFDTGNTLELNPEESDTYNQGVAYLEKIKQKWIADKALDPSLVVEGPRELRVWLYKPYDFPNLMGSAKLDRHFIYRDSTRTCLLVADLKSGWNPNLPPSSGSWQMKYQAVCIWKEEYEGVTDVRVAYVKAKDKCEHGDFCDYSEMDLKFSWDSVVFHSWESTQPDAPRHSGTHCRWCPCKAWCPEALAYSLLPVAIARGVLSGKKPAEAINEVTLDDLGRVWGAGATIRKILDEVSDRLKGLSKEELATIGIELGKGRELVQWTDPRGAFQLLTEKEKWDEAEVWKAFEPVLGRLAALQVKYSGVPEKEAPAMVKETLKAFYELKESAQILKRMK